MDARDRSRIRNAVELPGCSESLGANAFEAVAARSCLAMVQERGEDESAKAQDCEHPQHRPVAGRIRSPGVSEVVEHACGEVTHREAYVLKHRHQAVCGAKPVL